MKKSLLSKHALLVALLPAMALSASAADLVTVSRPTTPTAVKASAKQNAKSPAKRLSPRAAQSRASMSLDENFEGRTSATWLPDGWTQESKAGVANEWTVGDLENEMIYLQDGKYGVFCRMNGEAVDQWLNLPAVDVTDGLELTFRAYIDPFFSFVMGEKNEDYTYKEYVKTATMKVMVSTDEGATWTELLDLADQFVGLPTPKLTALANGELKPYAVSLGEYAGKKVRIAFRYVGTDGATVGMDDVKVGPAPLAGVRYFNPFCGAYFGVSKNMKAVPFHGAILPVYEPVTFQNFSDDYEAQYSWILPADDATTKVVEKDDWILTLEYVTDNTSDDTRRNNLKTPPTLVGETATASQSRFTSCDYIQAGGSGHFLMFGEPEPTNFGFATFSWPTCGGYALYSPSETEDIPMFGYSESADKYWADLNDLSDPGDYVHVNSLITYHACEAPIVINGAWLHAVGSAFKSDAVLKAEIITLDEDGVMDEVLATATLTPSQIETESAGSNLFYYTPEFKFDKNVVVTPEMCQAFITRISGFRESASYFNPYMTVNSNPAGLAFSWIEKEVKIGDDILINTMQPVAYCFEDGSTPDFALMLDAYFPYFEVPEETVNIAADQTVDLPVETYWQEEAHTFSNVPEGLKVSLTGRYDEARLHINYAGSEPLEGQFYVTCPGYTRVVKVSAEASGINDIVSDADSKQPVRYFTADGRELPSAPSAPGVYITRQGSVTAKKVIR